MFEKNTKDLARTINLMQDEARLKCRHDQPAMARQMAQWMASDRRFDSIGDKEQLAREAMDARLHGRALNLTEPVTIASGATGYIVRSV
jgi:hypothetical protein